MSDIPADYVFENHGSVWLCRPSSDAALTHLHKHTADALWWSSALVVEPRYVMDLAASLEADGYRTEV